MTLMSKVNDAIIKCYENSFILQDVYILIKLIYYTLYSFIEVFIKNVVTSNYLKKNIKGDIVLITGAGNKREKKINFKATFKEFD